MKKVFDVVSRGLLLIALGIIFFLINFGVLSWSFWQNVIDLWPLILILGGIALFFNRRIPFSTVLLVFLIALVSYSLVWGSFFPQGQFGRFYNFSLPFTGEQSSGSLATDIPMSSGLKRADIELNLGGAEVNLQHLTAEEGNQYLTKGNYMWEGAFTTRKPNFESSISGNAMNVVFTSEKRNGSGKSELNLNLSDKLRYSFDINAGACSGNLDFSHLQLDSLDMSTGAGKFTLNFGDTGVDSQVKINGAASDITLIAPEEVGLRVHMSGVVSSTNFMGSGLLVDNKDWVTPNYDTAKTKVDLDISTAAGSVRLERPSSSSKITY